MKTKVFISWSGDLGKSVAEKVREFIPAALPNHEAFFSKRDIKGGDVGIQRLVDELKSAKIGFILLTPDAVKSPWVLFESGCLFNGWSTKVFPILCGIDQSVLDHHPLGQVQCRDFNKADIRELVVNMNDLAIMNRHESTQVDHWFEAAWSKFEMNDDVSRLNSLRTSRSEEPSVADQVAAAIIGQGELATMNVEDLNKLVDELIQKRLSGGSTIDGGHF